MLTSECIAPRIPNFALDGCGGSVPHAGHFKPRAITRVPSEQEAYCAPEPIWTIWRREKSLVFAGIRTPHRPAHSLVTLSATTFRPPTTRRLSGYFITLNKGFNFRHVARSVLHAFSHWTPILRQMKAIHIFSTFICLLSSKRKLLYVYSDPHPKEKLHTYELDLLLPPPPIPFYVYAPNNKRHVQE